VYRGKGRRPCFKGSLVGSPEEHCCCQEEPIPCSSLQPNWQVRRRSENSGGLRGRQFRWTPTTSYDTWESVSLFWSAMGLRIPISLLSGAWSDGRINSSSSKQRQQVLPVSASHYVTWCQCSHALTDQDFISAQVLTQERGTVITRTCIIVHTGGVKPLLRTGHSGLVGINSYKWDMGRKVVTNKQVPVTGVEGMV